MIPLPTPAELAELEKMEQAATKAPWMTKPSPNGPPGRLFRSGCIQSDLCIDPPEDVALIAAMRNALPGLIAVARRVGEMEAVLRSIKRSFVEDHRGTIDNAAWQRVVARLDESIDAALAKEPKS